jgi:hypothetical protein
MSRMRLPIAHAIALVSFFFFAPTILDAQGDTDAKRRWGQINTTPSWIWSETEETQIHARREWIIDGSVKQAFVAASADNRCDVFFNDKKVLSSDDWAQIATADFLKHVKKGANQVAISATNEGGPSGLMALLVVVLDDGRVMELATDDTWIVSAKPKPNWKSAKTSELKWPLARVLGREAPIETAYFRPSEETTMASFDPR